MNKNFLRILLVCLLCPSSIFSLPELEDLQMLHRNGTALCYDYSSCDMLAPEVAPSLYRNTSINQVLDHTQAENLKYNGEVRVLRLSGYVTDDRFSEILARLQDPSFLPNLEVLDLSNTRISTYGLKKNYSLLEAVFNGNSRNSLKFLNLEGTDAAMGSREILSQRQPWMRRLIITSSGRIDNFSWGEVFCNDLSDRSQATFLHNTYDIYKAYFKVINELSASPRWRRIDTIAPTEDEKGVPLITEWDQFVDKVGACLDNDFGARALCMMAKETKAPNLKLALGKRLYESAWSQSDPTRFLYARQVFESLERDNVVELKGCPSFLLAQMIEQGHGFRKDPLRAQEYFVKAVQQGSEEAIRHLRNPE